MVLEIEAQKTVIIGDSLGPHITVKVCGLELLGAGGHTSD